MKSPDQKLFGVLSELSTIQRRDLVVFLNFLIRKKNVNWRRAQRLLSSLPVSNFEESDITISQIESVSVALEKVYSVIYKKKQNKGIAVIPKLPPRIKEGESELCVYYLNDVPVVDLVSVLSTIKDLPISLSFGKKILICISEKKGIFRVDMPNIRYEIRGKRLDIVTTIHSYQQPEVNNPEQKANLSRDIKDINDIFIKKLEVNTILIDHSDTIGYFLNRDDYEFIFEELPTELTSD